MEGKKVRRSDYCRNCVSFERDGKPFARGNCATPERPHIDPQKRVVPGPAKWPTRQADTCRLFMMRTRVVGAWLKSEDKNLCPKNGEAVRHPEDTIDLVLPCFVDKRCECLGSPVFITTGSGVTIKCFYPNMKPDRRGPLIRLRSGSS